VFYQFHRPPILFNRVELARAEASARGDELRGLERQWEAAFERRPQAVSALVEARKSGDPSSVATAEARLQSEAAQTEALRKRAIEITGQRDARADSDYIFLRFVLAEFPSGLVGLLIAVILCAAMSATASALNSLGSTCVVDFYRRSVRPDATDAHYLAAAKLFTVGWGVVALAFALGASLFENLIQAINILGSLFYGPMLGVFLVGFFTRRVGGTAAFVATLLAQAAVLAVWLGTSIGFLWYNVVGCGVVMAVALVSLAGGTRHAPR
jgi:Na+(H+)/acetate symporter ActP